MKIIIVLILVLSSVINLAAQNLNKITISDTTYLTNYPSSDEMFFQIQSEELINNLHSDKSKMKCNPVDSLLNSSLKSLYTVSVSNKMVGKNWIVFKDSSFANPVYGFYQDNDSTIYFEKFYPSGRIFQKGYLKVVTKDDIDINYEEYVEEDISVEEKVMLLHINSLVATNKWMFYYENGNVACEGEYSGRTKVNISSVQDLEDMDLIQYVYDVPFILNATKQGAWNYNDRNGKLVLIETYKSGEAAGYMCFGK